MNCEPGDLAIVVHSSCGNEGRIVTCLEFVGNRPIMRPDQTIFIGPIWKVSPPLPDWSGYLDVLVCDSQLRPIRDNPGEDESFRWAPSPTQKELA